MRTNLPAMATLAVLSVSLPMNAAGAAGDPNAGAEVFGVCAACHSLRPGRHMTGPSLARIWGRKAGSVEGFARYSPALKATGIVWNERTLDALLRNPRKFIPGIRMTFRGIEDRKARADLIAYLAAATSEGARPQGAQRGGMMSASEPQDVKRLGPARQVTAIRYCRDSYRVTTAAGETLPYWEFNLRFKTDSGAKGPEAGHPVLLPGGMMGDRAFVIFADPGEISAFIETRC